MPASTRPTLARWCALAGCIGFLAAACKADIPFGDPAPPLAFEATANQALSTIEVLTCPGERVLRLTVSRDESIDGVMKPGAVLWSIAAASSSTAALFQPAKPTSGFATITAPALPITGEIDIEVQTTQTSMSAGISTAELRTDAMTLGGADRTKLTAGLEKTVRHNHCG
jgi:hypothetical protein